MGIYSYVARAWSPDGTKIGMINNGDIAVYTVTADSVSSTHKIVLGDHRGSWRWQWMKIKKTRYVSCTGMGGNRLSIRLAPTLDRFVDSVDNIVGTVEQGDQILIVSDGSPVKYTKEQTVYTFIPIYFEGDIRYAAERADIYSKSSETSKLELVEQRYFLTKQRDPNCGALPVPPIIKPKDPARRTYYESFAGVVFWAVYNETSENKYESRLNLVDTLTTAYPEIARPSNEDLQTLGLDRYAPNGIDRRDHRYVMARLILENLDEFDSNPEGTFNVQEAYTRGFNYMTRWGGSIGNPRYVALWDPDAMDACGLGTYADVFNLDGGLVKLNWLTNFLNCRKDFPPEEDRLTEEDKYPTLFPYIEQAIEDKIANLRSPIQPDERGRGQFKHANRCYISVEEGCTDQSVDMITYCATRDCTGFNDAPSRVYSSGSVFEIGAVNVSDWLNGNFDNTTLAPGHDLMSPRNTRQQIVYQTQVGRDYFITVGTYNAGSYRSFLLMGNTSEPLQHDTLLNALSRHWERLYYIPNGPSDTSAMAYSPSWCILGLSHVINFERNGDQIWETFAYQGVGRDSWFCQP